MPSRTETKLWRSLHRRKGREESGRFLAEGPILLEELLDSGLTPEHVLYEAAPDAPGGAGLDGLLARARDAGARVEAVGEDEIASLADTVTPQGVLAMARIPAADWTGVGVGRVLVLDAVQDPGNLGTLVRTAEALALGAVVTLPGTVDPWNPKAVRAAAGSSFRVPILAAAWEEARGRFAEEDVVVWAAEGAGTPFRRGDVAPARLALVLGNEGRGVSDAVVADAARRVSVPMAGRVESLNVAVAGAVLMDRLFGV